jgi:hypothetical protein
LASALDRALDAQLEEFRIVCAGGVVTELRQPNFTVELGGRWGRRSRIGFGGLWMTRIEVWIAAQRSKPLLQLRCFLEFPAAPKDGQRTGIQGTVQRPDRYCLMK